MNKIIRLKDVLAITGLSRSSVYLAISENRFPSQIPLGPRAVGWLSTEIEQWVSDCVSQRI